MHGPDFQYASESMTMANSAVLSFPNQLTCARIATQSAAATTAAALSCRHALAPPHSRCCCSSTHTCHMSVRTIRPQYVAMPWASSTLPTAHMWSAPLPPSESEAYEKMQIGRALVGWYSRVL